MLSLYVLCNVFRSAYVEIGVAAVAVAAAGAAAAAAGPAVAAAAATAAAAEAAAAAVIRCHCSHCHCHVSHHLLPALPAHHCCTCCALQEADLFFIYFYFFLKKIRPLHKHWPRSVPLHVLIWAVLLPPLEPTSFYICYLLLFNFHLFPFLKNRPRHQPLPNSVACLAKMRLRSVLENCWATSLLRCMWIDGWGGGGCVE